MNTSNLKTFPGYIIGTDLTGGCRVNTMDTKVKDMEGRKWKN